VNHFPFRRGDADKYTDYRPVDRGGWLLHGHIHELWRQSGRQINVGVDAWAGRPVSFSVLKAMIEAGEQSLGVLEWRNK
jgi:calcineurin-like phosphoesterase family protein